MLGVVPENRNTGLIVIVTQALS